MRITVAIPTIVGRIKYLESTLRTCVAQNYDNLEIIVSDNSPGGALEVVQSFKDERIRYIRPDYYLPMSAHWDFMTSHFTGDMVTIIGDDDGLMPGALHRVSEIVRSHGQKPIQHTLVNYCWSDFPEAESRDKFWFIHSPGSTLAIRRSKDYLMDLCQAKARYIDGPMIYHNFIPNELLKRLRINSSIFHRSSPDVYSSITIAAHTDAFIETKEVLTMSGQGARANGAAVRDGGADGKRFITEMQSTEYFSRYRSLTVQLQTLDSILEASERYSKPELKDWIDYGEHFCGAANECLDMPVRSRAARQMALVAWEATKSGCLQYLIRNRGAKFLAKIGQAHRGHPVISDQTVEECGFNTGVKYEVSNEVTDIYSATIHVHQLLKRDCKP
jgi:glycosyltransferase involved in cell wall biosynthesis